MQGPIVQGHKLKTPNKIWYILQVYSIVWYTQRKVNTFCMTGKPPADKGWPMCVMITQWELIAF